MQNGRFGQGQTRPIHWICSAVPTYQELDKTTIEEGHTEDDVGLHVPGKGRRGERVVVAVGGRK
jgi:hypothetical protein